MTKHDKSINNLLYKAKHILDNNERLIQSSSPSQQVNKIREGLVVITYTLKYVMSHISML